MMWKRWIRILVVSLMMGAPLVPMAANEQGSALYKAARLRYLSQRIAKAYMQGALDIRADKAAQIIDSSVKQSQGLLADLKRTSAVQPQLAKAFADVETKTEVFYAFAAGKPSTSKAPEMVKLSDEIFALGDQLTAGYQALEKSPIGKLQNVAGRERGLSQRMARDFFMMRLGHASAAANLPRARQEFNASLETLATAPVSTPAIQGNLALLRAQWVFFEQALNHADAATAANNVATTSERILEVLDELVDQYEAVMRSLR